MTFSLENFPAGLKVDEKKLAEFMERRAPGRDKLSTARRETDEVVFTSGLSDGVTTGGTIHGEIASRDMRPGDYGAERTIPRPGHADFGQWIEMGRIPTGGGKNSGRLTAPLCAAGALCLLELARRGIWIQASIESLGGVYGGTEKDYEKAILDARNDGDSVGGTVSCSVHGLPPGLCGPLFEGLESGISAALFGIPGVKGVAFGCRDGQVSSMRGSEYNDAFVVKNGLVGSTMRQGGIMGGRTYGMPVMFTVAMRPTPTVFKPQQSVDLATMKPAECVMKGRHDPCIVRRALPVIEAATAFAVVDAILADEASHPRICLTLTGKTLAEDIAQYESQRYFTDMVELRVDLLKKSERAKVAEFPKMLAKSSPWKVPIVLTFRKACDGGAFNGKEEERLAFFRRVLNSKPTNPQTLKPSNPFSYVDFEEGFGSASLVALAHAAGAKVIRSMHKFDGPVKNLAAKLRELGKDGDIAKIAFMPRNLGDVAKAFAITPNFQLPTRSVIIAMGPQGLATRVLAGRLGSEWTYASVGGLDEIGHVTPYELVRDYRFRSVTKDAALFGVTGWPLKKTRSPEINNAAFAAEDEDAVLVPFPAKTAKEAFAFMKAMGMKGMAVTIPHKFAIMPLLDRIDGFAKKVGAVNTVVREGDRYVGYNTDVDGFAEALSAFAGDLRGKSAAVLGDGGAAQAVKVALKRLGVKFRVFHRETPPQGFDILVNATPVDPIPDYAFTGRELVYDLRYVPEVTPLMARAAKAGCRVENGFSMLLAQARAQRVRYA
jgi:3-dehydroquinate dehydratase/shikimate dehydrogenase